MKVELVTSKPERVDAQLAHVHRMTGELAFALQLVALGLFVLATAVYLTGKGE